MADQGVVDRIFAPGPKRVLAIDSGGVRAAFSLGVLADMESRFTQRARNDGFRLSRYFDLIGGTGSGAVIAACLAFGWTVTETAKLVEALAPSLAALDQQGAEAAHAPLAGLLGQAFGQHAFDSIALRTGLCLLARRDGAGSAIFSNSPLATAWQGRDGGYAGARDCLVAGAVEAALTGGQGAAVEVAPGVRERFQAVDLVGASNPALALLKAAALKPHGFEWAVGPDRLLLVSVGAGIAPGAQGVNAIRADAARDVWATIQSMALCPRPAWIDDDLGDMRGAVLSPVPLVLAHRFDVALTPEALEALGLDAPPTALNGSGPETLATLFEAGRRVVQAQFAPRGDLTTRQAERAVFPKSFDPPGAFTRAAGPPANRLEALGRMFERTAKSAG